MSLDETKSVTLIMLTADSFCSNCASDLLDQLKEMCPEHAAAIDALYARREEIAQAYRDQQAAFWNENGPKPSILRCA